MSATVSGNTTHIPSVMHHPNLDPFNSSVYIHCLPTYYVYYGIIPNIKTMSGLDAQKCLNWVENTFQQQITRKHIKEGYDSEKKKMEFENVLYLLDNEVLIDIEDNGVVCVVYKPGDETHADHILENLKKMKKVHRKESKIGVITTGARGLDITDIKCPNPKLQLTKNYNDDLQSIHKEIIRGLSQNDKSGLVLLHGKPGTGKSTYIRYLVNNISKQFIFISPHIAGNLDAPNFINLLIENRNSVLVIEDAEDVLSSREKAHNSAISILLNLTDGILGESLGIQTICTFNTKLQNIDEALMRKGRLMAMYEFRELATDKANVLLKDLGTDHTTNIPMTLADIYNLGKKGYVLEPPKAEIGFKVK
jgi:ATPase family associated with various cellular activities (AAA)